jgi:hypothetical protein
LLVNPNGASWWRFKYQFENREKLLSLGVYPHITLQQARYLASAILPAVIAYRHRHQVEKPYNHWWCYALWLLATALISLMAYKGRGTVFGYDLYRAPSVAMSPTIKRDDFFLVDARRYHHHAPATGEVVVLHLNDGTGTKYVKRIVGIPGDRIELRDSALFRNGQPVNEPYVHLVAPFPSYGRD